jgi:nitroimidazol reductase NimA-like FMN-containing flavoprotein (pyridoxamine 5'-phosphate oxidase superfamily)
MAVIEGRTGLEVMPLVGCKRHLATETTGRVAVIVDGHPEIFPVNYAVDDSGAIFFRTDRGTKLDAVAASPSIAFEIDGFDEERQLGWSVLVLGPARRLATPSEIAHAKTLPLEPWAAGEKVHTIRLSPAHVSGRRIHRRHDIQGVPQEV